MRRLLLILVLTGNAVAAERPGGTAAPTRSGAELPAVQKWSALAPPPAGAIETRPIWDRPSLGLSLHRETDAALDRGNGRIVDPATFELRQIEVSRAAAGETASGTEPRIEFRNLQEVLEHQRQLDQAQMRATENERRTRVVEVESQRLAAERERFMKFLTKPRHAEAAVVENQTEKKQ